jgi:hypothetical protein
MLRCKPSRPSRIPSRMFFAGVRKPGRTPTPLTLAAKATSYTTARVKSKSPIRRVQTSFVRTLAATLAAPCTPHYVKRVLIMLNGSAGRRLPFLKYFSPQ